MKKLAVVFPGRRYSCDRSLLYFPSELMRLRGYDMVYLHYNLEKEVEDPRPLSVAIEESFQVSKKALADVDLSAYDTVVFLGKSIGTVVQGQIREEVGRPSIRIIDITPLPETVKYFAREDLILVGDHDPNFPDPNRILTHYPNNYVFPSFTHSLESKTNYHLSIKIVNDVTTIVDQYLRSFDPVEEERQD